MGTVLHCRRCWRPPRAALDCPHICCLVAGCPGGTGGVPAGVPRSWTLANPPSRRSSARPRRRVSVVASTRLIRHPTAQAATRKPVGRLAHPRNLAGSRRATVLARSWFAGGSNPFCRLILLPRLFANNQPICFSDWLVGDGRNDEDSFWVLRSFCDASSQGISQAWSGWRRQAVGFRPGGLWPGQPGAIRDDPTSSQQPGAFMEGNDTPCQHRNLLP